MKLHGKRERRWNGFIDPYGSRLEIYLVAHADICLDFYLANVLSILPILIV